MLKIGRTFLISSKDYAWKASEAALIDSKEQQKNSLHSFILWVMNAKRSQIHMLWGLQQQVPEPLQKHSFKQKDLSKSGNACWHSTPWFVYEWE